MKARSLCKSWIRPAAFFAAAGFVWALGPGGAAAQTQLPPPSAYSQADARQDRIEELEGQLRDATAENERLQFELMRAEREIRRLNAMVGELAGVNQDLQREPEPPAPPEPRQPPAAGNGAAPGGLSAAQQRATGTLGTMSREAAAAAPPAPAPDPAASYSRARELLVNGRYAEAEVAFRDFLAQNPQVETAADARFWYAFTLLARNNYPDAAAGFIDYLQRTPNGPRAPEAQVRLGMALAGMGEQRQACAAFAALPRRYPNAPRDVREIALRESRASACPS